VICVRTLLMLLVVALAGCGADERSAEERSPAATSTGPTAPAPAAGKPGAGEQAAPARAATGPTGAASAPAAPPAAGAGTANPGGASAGEGGAGGAGDEEPIRQPATFTIGGGVVVPASVSVAPFLAVSLTVVNADASAHRIRLSGTEVAFTVAPGKARTRVLAGLKAGRYALSVDSRADPAALVVGDTAGP
jgi:hypothetical protein